MVEQVVIVVCGIGTVWFSQSREFRLQRWACLFGVVAQPAWFYAAWSAGQWGIFAVSLLYLAGWLRGVYNFWGIPAGGGKTKEHHERTNSK